MDISSIHFHDTQILRVIEDATADTLTMEVEYPVDWEHNVFEKRCLVFECVHGYQVFDGPFVGRPTILDASIISTDGRWSRVRLETNAGRRELNCTAIRLIEYEHAAWTERSRSDRRRRAVGKMQPLAPNSVHETLKKFFPSKNDDFKCGYSEELKELNDFGIATEEQLFRLLRKRADEVMEIDRSPMSESDLRMHSDADGGESVAKRIREGYWFSYPALLRIALELEYGKAYEEYAKRRDEFA